MEFAMKPVPVSRKFFTPGVIVILALVLNGFVFLAGRFLFGIGAVTNLDNSYPWGIWIGFDVMCGVGPKAANGLLLPRIRSWM